MVQIIEVIGGGQTGADRGGLDAARAAGVPIAGSVPRGWATEDGHPDHWRQVYPELHELTAGGYPVRTMWNVRSADATLIVVGSDSIEHHRGSMLTLRTATRLGKPVYVSNGNDLGEVRIWLQSIGLTGVHLNVAGPRESGEHGIYRLTYDLVTDLIKTTDSGTGTDRS